MSKFIGQISGYTRQYVLEKANYIAGLERMFGREIKIAERGHQILINSGTKTSVLDINSISSTGDLMDHIQNNCVANENIRNKAFKFMEWFKNVV